MKERILGKKEIETMLVELQEAAVMGENSWNRLSGKYTGRKALFEFPLGEMMNPKVGGYIGVWGLRNMIQTKPITEKDRFKAQGLEGKASVPMTLLVALFAWGEFPEHRRQIIEIQEEHIR